MNEFKIFQVNKAATFLGRVKSNKDKRADQAKKNINLLKIQKNIRAFLASNKQANHHYPLLIRTTQQITKNSEFVQNLWICSQSMPNLLKRRITALTIQALMQDKILNINIQKLLLAIIEEGQNNRYLKINHFDFLIEKYFQIMCFTNLLAKLMKIPYFKIAFEKSLSYKVTRLVFLLQQTNDVNLTNQIIESYFNNSKTKFYQQKDEQSLQELRLSFFKAVQLVFKSIQIKTNEDHQLYLLSVILQKLKNKFIDIILATYKIDKNLYYSTQFTEQIKELLQQKQEWKQYQECIMPLTQLLPHFLAKFYKSNIFSVEFTLKIVVEITKFNQTFDVLKLQNNQFFLLLERLDSKGLLTKQQFQLKQYELLFTVIILEKYLQSLNDIHFINQFRYDKQKMGKYIKTYVIKFMKDMCSLTNQTEITKEILRHSQLLMSNLYNKLFRTHLLSTSIFEDHSFTVLLASNKINSNTKFYNEMVLILERSPFLLPIDTRFTMFKNIVRKDKYQNYHHQNIEVRVRRKHEFQDAFDALYKRSLKNRIRVVFINEFNIVQSGMDGGGLTKELLTRVFKVAFDPKFSLFVQNDKKQLMPNPEYQNIKQDQQIAKMYEFVGQLLGKSLYENIMLGVKFAGPFLNLLINKKNTFDDLQSVDPELYRSVVYIMGMQEGVEDLQLTFVYQDNISKKYINLVPQGHLVKVTDQNKMQYIHLFINYKVNHSFQRQTRFLRKGLRQMIKDEWLKIFNYAEMNYLISGSGVIDINDWRLHTVYRGVNNKEYIDNFWLIVKDFTEQQKSLLLKFVTSCQRPSFLGFKDLSPPFCISLFNQNLHLPTSHTCSNVLDLPIYKSVQILKQKLLYAIKSGAGFEFA